MFCFLESAQDSNRKRKPRYQYESFYIEYQLGEGDLSYLLNSLELFDGSEEKRDSIQAQINKLQKYVFNTNDPLYIILRKAEERIK